MRLPENSLISGALLSLIVLFIVCLGYISQLWSILSVSTRVSVATATLGVIGTLFLAVATFWTVHQNSRLIEERMREREKPIAKEELNEFIEPSITITASNAGAIDEAVGLEWINATPKRTYDIGDQTAILETEIQMIFVPADPFLRDRITGEESELFNLIEEHNQMVKRFSEHRREVAQEIQGEVEEFLQERGYEDEFQDDEIEILLDAILKESDCYADHPEFWESTRDELIALAHNSASEIYDEIEQDTERYSAICESLQDRLRSRRVQLKEEYGIISGFDPEEDTITAV